MVTRLVYANPTRAELLWNYLVDNSPELLSDSSDSSLVRSDAFVSAGTSLLASFMINQQREKAIELR